MIRLIAAMDRQQGIAKQGFLPWYIPEDEAFFTEQTKLYGGNALVGNTTFKTFHGPLAERHNYVLTHDKTPIAGAELIHDLEKFLRDMADQDIWVIGGANVFAQVMELGKADELYLTRIQADFGCNQFFPPFDQGFTLIEQTELHEQNGFIFTYCKYTKT
jgi:dihydrofolate reductase